MNGRSDRAWESLGFRGSGFLMLDALWMRCQNIRLSGSLAQSVEHRTFNPLVARSSRARPARFSLRIKHMTPPSRRLPCFSRSLCRRPGVKHESAHVATEVIVRPASGAVYPYFRASSRPARAPTRSAPLSRRLCRAAGSLFSVICYRNNSPNRHGKFLFRIPLIRDRAI